MKLKSLWIEEFKNLKNINIDFAQGNGLTMLIGTNGSGKSNVLEAISAIFASLYDRKKTTNFAYEIKYVIENVLVCISKKAKDKLPNCVVYEYYGRKEDLKDSVKIGNKALIDFLPSRVIAVYSGEEERLWKNHYEAFYKKHSKAIISGASNLKQNMIYLNKDYWQPAFLTLLTSQNNFLKEDLESKIGISFENITNIFFRVNQNSLKKNKDKLIGALVGNLFMPETLTHRENKTIAEINFTLGEYHIHFCNNNLLPDTLLDRQGRIELTNDMFLPSREYFELFAICCVPKNNKIIEKVEIRSDRGFSLDQLSEGEKRLILLKCSSLDFSLHFPFF